MHGPRKTLVRFVPYLLVVALTACLWIGSFYLRDRMLAPCTDAGQCTTFVDYSMHDPFCILEPTCVSPFYNPSWSGGAPHWQGLRWIDDSLLISGSGLTMLAIPNLILFALLATAAIVVATLRVDAGRRRNLAITAISTWCILEVAGWIATVGSLDPEQHTFTLGTAMLLLIAASWLGCSAYIAGRIQRRN